jgi:hypothetical protein
MGDRKLHRHERRLAEQIAAEMRASARPDVLFEKRSAAVPVAANVADS